MGLRKAPDERFWKLGDDKRTVHLRIASEFRNEILNGDIEVGEALPTTQAMCAAYDASSTAVQNAMRALKDEELVVGQKGKSITAAEPRIRVMRPASYLAPAKPGEPYRWVAEAEKRGLSAKSDLIEVSEVEPPLSVAKALGIAKGATAILRRQLLSLNGEPAELVDNYYPLEIAAGTALERPEKIRGGASTLLSNLGYPVRRAVDRVSARTPTVDQGNYLKMPVGELPVLRTFRVTYADDDRVVEVTVMAKAGHLYELEYDLTVD
jgi:GntR family transcriptional regulator